MGDSVVAEMYPRSVYLVVPVGGGPVAHASWSEVHAHLWLKRERSGGGYKVIGPFVARAREEDSDG